MLSPFGAGSPNVKGSNRTLNAQPSVAKTPGLPERSLIFLGAAYWRNAVRSLVVTPPGLATARSVGLASTTGSQIYERKGARTMDTPT